jgi:hypothetical protein
MRRTYDVDFYVKNGVAVFPLSRLTKVPAVPKGTSWKDFDLWNWDYEGFDGNIGLICGQTFYDRPRRLCVVDLDTERSRKEIIRHIDIRLLIALDKIDTLRVCTPNGGIHYYVAVPEEMDFGVFKMPWGEVRNVGAYVVAPDSFLRTADGQIRQYVYARKFTDFWDAIRDAPDELIQWVLKKTPVVSGDPFEEPDAEQGDLSPPFGEALPAFGVQSGAGRIVSIDPDRHSEILKAIENGLAEGECVSDYVRGRNDAAFWYTFIQLYRGEERQGVWRKLQEWNQKNRPPLEMKELFAVYRSAEKIAIARREEREWLGNEWEQDPYFDALDDAHKGNGLKPISAWELIQKPSEPIVAVYPPFAYKGGISVVYAPPGEGKSFAMLRMAIEAARRGFKAVYLSLEMPETMVKEYLKVILETEKIEPQGEMYVLYSPREIQAIEKYDLLIIDSLRAFNPGVDLNNSSQVEKLFNYLRQAFLKDSSLVLVHHTNKPAMGPHASEIDVRAMAEGSLRVISASDLAVYLHRDTTCFLMDIVKTRYGPTGTVKKRFPFPVSRIRIAGDESTEW